MHRDRHASVRPGVKPLPAWPAIVGLLYGVALIVAAHTIATGILHLNSARAISELLAASVVPETQPDPDHDDVRPPPNPLNPANWSLFRPPSDDAHRAERLKLVRRQIGTVEGGAVVWRWTVYGLGAATAALSYAALLWRRRRGALLAAVVALAFAAAVLGEGGLWAVVRYGGFDQRPVSARLITTAMWAAFPVAMTAALIVLRRMRRRAARGARLGAAK